VTLQLRAAAATDTGRVRPGNEDAYLVDDRIGLYAVADGMGGHRAGEVASATALEAVRAAFASGVPIDESIARANDAILEKAMREDELRGMGTTITVLATTADQELIGQVGDSRAYLVRNHQLLRLTEDHSLVEELVREGRITPAQAQVHPQRSVITRALGIHETVEVDVFALRLRRGDRIVLCSDGLTSMVRDDTIARVVEREADPDRAATELVAAANAAGGADNITVVVIDVLAGAEPVDDGQPAARRINATPTPVPAPEVPVVAPSPPPRRRAGRAAGRAAKIALVALPILLVLAVGIGAVAWYARASYFVGFDRDTVTVFQGRAGGVLGWNPTVADRSDVARSELTPQELLEVGNEPVFGSKEEAQAYVRRLRARVDDRVNPTTTSAPTTTASPTPTLGGTTASPGVPR